MIFMRLHPSTFILHPLSFFAHPAKFLLGLALATPALAATDTDLDGLPDSFELAYTSPSSATSMVPGADADGDSLTNLQEFQKSTNPLIQDTDGDGAGDWYEVTATDTDPTLASSKPNIPYPLPDPDSTPPATGKPVKVFILSGQSNMVGQGDINGTALGTLETITKREGKFPNLLNASNAWTSRNDVAYRGVVSAIAKAQLAPGQGNSATAIGPELGFGHVMGYHHDEPVLILKSSMGGRALGWDFLPPGSVPYAVGSTTYAGYGNSPASWTTGTTPVPTAFYGGYQYDQCFLKKADWAPAGASLPAVFNVTDVLDNFATEYPEYAAQGFEIAGFAWWQGWNDGLSYTSAYANRYEVNMAQFIRRIRSYYEGRYPGNIKPKAPFVLATCAFEGWNEAYLNQYLTRRAVINAQFAMIDPKYPDFVGSVKTVEARGYWRDKSISPSPGGNQGYHYNRNAETFMLVGDALGRGMIDLLKNYTLPQPWQTAKFGTTNLAGNVSYFSGTHTVTGSGLWSSTSDTGYYVYQNLSGDGQITARISSLQNTGGSARVGVMIRNSLAQNSARVYMGMENAADYRWGFRTTDGGSTAGNRSGAGTVPNTWVRLTRRGNYFNCAKSADGVTWTTAGIVTATLASNCYIGLWISSGSNTTTNTSVFDSINVTP